MSPNELVLPFGGSYVCAEFGENRSRNATARVLADGHTDRRKPILYNLSNAICYSYEADKNDTASHSVQRLHHEYTRDTELHNLWSDLRTAIVRETLDLL